MFPVALSPPRNPGMSQDTEDGERSSYGEWGHQMRSPGAIRPPTRSPQGLPQPGNTTHVLWVTTLMSLKNTRSHEDLSETVQSIFICVFICQIFNGAQIFQTKVWKMWEMPFKPDALRGRVKHARTLTCKCTPNLEQAHNIAKIWCSLGPTTSRWVGTSAAFKRSKVTRSSFCVGQRCCVCAEACIPKVIHDSLGPRVHCFELTQHIETTSMTRRSSRD